MSVTTQRANFEVDPGEMKLQRVPSREADWREKCGGGTVVVPGITQ